MALLRASLSAPRSSSSEHGFTLIELFVLVVLSSLCATIGLSALRVQVGRSRLAEASARISAALVQSRSGAVHEDQIWKIEVRESTLRVYAGASPRAIVRMPVGVSTTLNSGGEIRFYPDGHTENATFRIKSDFGEKTVVLNQRGRVRLP